MNPILMVVWALLAASFMGLLVYRGQLTRYEDDQLFPERRPGCTRGAARAASTRCWSARSRSLQPVVTALGGAAGLVTASVVGIYVWTTPGSEFSRDRCTDPWPES